MIYDEFDFVYNHTHNLNDNNDKLKVQWAVILCRCWWFLRLARSIDVVDFRLRIMCTSTKRITQNNFYPTAIVIKFIKRCLE